MCVGPVGPETDRMNYVNKFVLILLGLGILAVPIFAQGNADNATNKNLNKLVIFGNATELPLNESEVGALPGDVFYGFKRFFENVDMFFTKNKSESAYKHARFGKLRAMEAHLLSGRAEKLEAEGRYAEANATLKEIERLTGEQQQESEDAIKQVEEAANEGSAKEKDVEKVNVEIRNSIIVLQRVYAKAPAPAKDAILRALNNSINNQERHEQKMAERGFGRGLRNETAGNNETHPSGNVSKGSKNGKGPKARENRSGDNNENET